MEEEKDDVPQEKSLGMEKMIAMMSKIDDILSTVGSSDLISLPQIVAIGSQSSGKSSVLENIVGREFFPRSNGICTRRPLKLELIQTEREEVVEGVTVREWARFHHLPDRTFTDWEEVRQEIIHDTEKVCGSNKGINPDAISLKVYSPHVVSLTLIDLPGITRIPIGDQPANIEEQITEMIMKYIEKPNTLILAVTPANTDFATSESIKLARLVDPEGQRTLAVVTKLDLMDAGTDAMDVLCGRVFHINLGIVGVVCRSQADLNAKKSMKVALEKERKFLTKRYPSLASRSGTPYLRRRLSALLATHIRDCLPEIAMKINVLKRQFQHQLLACGKPVEDPHSTLLQLLTKFAGDYQAAIDGTGDVVLQELSGGARINYIFHETFGRTLEGVEPLEGLSRLEVLTAIKNSTGPRTAVFVPDLSFELLVKKQISRLEEPSIRCVELVHEELERIIQHCITKQYHRFPRLVERLKEVVTQKITARMDPTKQFIQDLISNELAYINTRHPDFSEARQQACQNLLKVSSDYTDLTPEIQNLKMNGEQKGTPEKGKEVGSGDSISPPKRATKKQKDKMNPKEKRECEVVERLIKTYFLIIRKNIQDSVPKAVMNFLVNHVKDALQGYLVQKLYKPTDLDSLLAESDFIAEQRREYQLMLNAYESAQKTLNEVRDSSTIQW